MVTPSLKALNRVNLLVALMQTGFGAFLSVYLTTHGWRASEIGGVLSAAALAAMVAQIPAGMLVDAARDKRIAAGVAVMSVMLAALVIGISPGHGPVLVAEIMQGAAGCVLGPAIAAITIALARKEGLGERLGHNVRFAAMGSMLAAGVMGVVGTWYSHRATLFLAAVAGAGAIGALLGIRRKDMATARLRTDHKSALREKPGSRRDVITDPALLLFGGCVFLFHLGNAGLLPLAAGIVTREDARHVELFVAAAIVVPQFLAAMLSPRIGRLAQAYGRRAVLIGGCLALAGRALLMASDGTAVPMIAFQALDGISAAVMGVLVPLVVAVITHRRGRFNLAMGIVGVFMGVGAALSTALAGGLADRFGNEAAFLMMAISGALAAMLAWFGLPETRHRSGGATVRAAGP